MKKEVVETFLSGNICSDAETWSQNITVLAKSLIDLSIYANSNLEDIGVIFGRVIGDYSTLTNHAIGELNHKIGEYEQAVETIANESIGNLESKIESEIDFLGSKAKSGELLNRIEEDVRKIDAALQAVEQLPALKRKLEDIRHKWLYPHEHVDKAA